MTTIMVKSGSTKNISFCLEVVSQSHPC